MRKAFAAVLCLTVLAGCAWTRKSDNSDIVIDYPRGRNGNGTPPPFALPGVPLRSDLAPAAARPAEYRPAETAAAPPVSVMPAEAKPAPAPAKTSAPVPAAAKAAEDFEFHISAAKRYAGKKQYRSAAAEYAAAGGYLPAGDARAVHLLERQGAMLLRAGDEPKALERFSGAIETAAQAGHTGNDLANAHLGRAYCLEKAGKVPDALQNYERALALSSSKVIKARIAETIGGLKKNP
jgi:tetratricopeptide (TPR) repeat protein